MALRKHGLFEKTVGKLFAFGLATAPIWAPQVAGEIREQNHFRNNPGAKIVAVRVAKQGRYKNFKKIVSRYLLPEKQAQTLEKLLNIIDSDARFMIEKREMNAEILTDIMRDFPIAHHSGWKTSFRDRISQAENRKKYITSHVLRIVDSAINRGEISQQELGTLQYFIDNHQWEISGFAKADSALLERPDRWTQIIDRNGHVIGFEQIENQEYKKWKKEMNNIIKAQKRERIVQRK